MLLLAPISIALADTDPWEDGFVSPPRDDAPTDGVLVYAANYLPRATVVSGPGAPFELEGSYITGVGATHRITLHPPEGGWVPEETYALSVLGYHEDDGEVATLSFTTGSGTSPPPGPPVVGEVSAGGWSEATLYPWGCCSPSRLVEVEVTVPDADPWARVEIVGRFDLGRPSQITTQEIHTHLDVGMGPGPHTLRFLQWEDERGPQPPCFDVVSVSAAGLPGPFETRCADDPAASDTGAPTDARTCGCASGPRPDAPIVVPWLLLALARLRRATRRGTAVGGHPCGT